MLVILFFYNSSVFQKKKLTEKNSALVKFIDEKTKQSKDVENVKGKMEDESRLLEACRLLREHPDMKVADVAKKVQFTPQRLQKLFRERYTMSLTEYRLSHKK